MNHLSAGRPSRWDEYAQDILAFAPLVDRHFVPSEKSRVFLRAVQRGYARVGLTGAPDAWRALALACLWQACCHHDRIQLIAAGSEKSGQAWLRFLRELVGQAVPMVQDELSFDDGLTHVMAYDTKWPAMFVLSPRQASAVLAADLARPTTVVMPDLGRVATKLFRPLGKFVSRPGDQWLVVSPVLG